MPNHKISSTTGKKIRDLLRSFVGGSPVISLEASVAVLLPRVRYLLAEGTYSGPLQRCLNRGYIPSRLHRRASVGGSSVAEIVK